MPVVGEAKYRRSTFHYLHAQGLGRKKEEHVDPKAGSVWASDWMGGLRLKWNAASCARKEVMLWTIFAILLVLWLLGVVSGYTLSGFIHLLLIVAIVVVLIRVIQGRKPL